MLTSLTRVAKRSLISLKTSMEIKKEVSFSAFTESSGFSD